MEQTTLVLPDHVEPQLVLGQQSEVLQVLMEHLAGLEAWNRGGIIGLAGDTVSVKIAQDLLEELIIAADHGHALSAEAVEQALSVLAEQEMPSVKARRGKMIKPKSAGQLRYLQAMEENRIIFGIGPAGTGKTYLAMAKAVEALQTGKVKRIILTRPAVEAGESLGFLPGNLTEKIDPYLRPLFDALRDLLEPNELEQLLESGTIEVAALAYMRGRTLSEAFIVLDEAQNTTSPQMKMFLTRLGRNSTMVVTGDITQIDLPSKAISGLKEAQAILAGLPQIEFCLLNSSDVVREALVGQIIEAYEQA